MGLSSKKSKTTTNQNTTATITPTNPGFTTDAIGGLAGRTENYFKGLDPYSLVPGADTLQLQAAGGAGRLGTYGPHGGGNVTPATSSGPAWAPGGNLDGGLGGVPVNGGGLPDKRGFFDANGGGGTISAGAGGNLVGSSGADTLGGPPTGGPVDPFTEAETAGPQHVGEQNIASYLSQVQDPYTDQVVNTTLAGFDQNAGRTRAQQQLDLAGDTTFGGSGGSILRSLTEGELGRGRAQTEAELRDQGFQTALGAATNQAGLNQQTGLANAGFGETALNRKVAAGQAQGGEDRANVTTQFGIGDLLRQIKAAQAGAPITALNANAGILGGTPFDLLKGSNATGSLSGTSTSKESGAGLGDWLGFFAANAAAAAKGAGGG